MGKYTLEYKSENTGREIYNRRYKSGNYKSENNRELHIENKQMGNTIREMQIGQYTSEIKSGKYKFENTNRKVQIERYKSNKQKRAI